MPRGFTILYFVFLLSSCYSPRYVYSPATQNLPLLTKKNDVKVGGYVAGGLGSNDLKVFKKGTNLGIDGHGAYAITDHFATMINYYRRWERNSVDNDLLSGDSIIINYHRSLVEMGAGYFTLLGHANTSFQIFGGLALGKFRINEKNAQNLMGATRFHNSNIDKIFIQPSFISGIKKHFTASFSSRFSMVYFNKISTDYTQTEQADYFLSDLTHSPVFFWEPAMDYVLGCKKMRGIKIELQVSFSVLMNRRFVDYRTMNFAMGIISDLRFKHAGSSVIQPLHAAKDTSIQLK